ncbi:hypothetical protein B0J14DRAFT_472792 [Halenospora varia]|nr:hypothetical protein B0J14DRAFT_472792 [Halenospora varia]
MNGKSGQNATIGWQPEPTTRGTSGLLPSCVITIFLCVWRAVHINIPAKCERYARYGRKFGWLALGMIAPEVVVFAAWHQYNEARKLTNKVKELQENLRGKGLSRTKVPTYV